VNGGELYFHVANFGRFSEERVRFYAVELILALRELHKKGYIYRDLKLENILLTKDGHIKITDFGLSQVIPNSTNIIQQQPQQPPQQSISPSDTTGTLEYMAPEILLGQPSGISIDWWALGVVLYEMSCAFHPFWHEDRHIIHERILTAPIDFPSWISMDLQDLISNLLERNPIKRLGSSSSSSSSSNEQHQIQNHPFFKSIQFDQILTRSIPPPYIPADIGDALLDPNQLGDQLMEEEHPLSELSPSLKTEWDIKSPESLN